MKSLGRFLKYSRILILFSCILTIFLITSCKIDNRITGFIYSGSISAPTGIIINNIPSGFSDSANFSWTASTGTGLSHYEVKILEHGTDTEILGWTTITSGSSLSGLALNENKIYYAVFRAVDKLNKVSPEAESPRWLPNSDNCQGDKLFNAPYAEGIGSHSNPYQLCTPTQVAAIAANASDFYKVFKLMANVDMSGVLFDGIGGTFSGRFLGNNKAIKNMTINRPTPGSNAAFFNDTYMAYVSDLTFVDPVVSAATSNNVAVIFGGCDESTARNITISNAIISGQSYVGTLMGGWGYQCNFSEISLTSQVNGSGGSIGGLSGDDEDSEYLNINANVTVVSTTGASEVGGAIGSNGYSRTHMQNVHVIGTVTGGDYVGGLVGGISDGIEIYRSSFQGTVTGDWGVGGFIGGINDSPCGVYSSSANVTVNGNDAVGGFTGYHGYSCDYFDSYVTGIINGTGVAQDNIGGFLGYVDWQEQIHRSYADVTITGTSSHAGGAIGYVGYWSASNAITDSFVTGNVQGASASDFVSWFMGELASNPMNSTNIFYWSGATCDNTGAGNCNSNDGAPIANLNYFYDKTNLPLSNWDFVEIWQENATALPTLRSQQFYTPSVTHNCAVVASVGGGYNCNLTITDLDKNEVRMVILQPDHTCDWMMGLDHLKGSPDTGQDGICLASFVVSDGVNDSPVVQFNVTVSP